MDGKRLSLCSGGKPAELIIFDRRGVEVYRDDNYTNNWDGLIQ